MTRRFICQQSLEIRQSHLNRSAITDGERWYVELKHTLQTRFNHSFSHLRYIVRDLDRSMGDGTEFTASVMTCVACASQKMIRKDGSISSMPRTKIQIIRLTEYLKNCLSLTFEPEPRGPTE